jgi:signal transduction histidine kinase
MRSLSRHLTISLAVSLAGFFLVQALLVGTEMRKLSEDSVLSRLEDDMESVLATLSIAADGELTMEQEHIPAIFMRPLSGHYFQIRQGQQVIRSRSLWDSQLSIENPGVYRAVKGPSEQQLLILSRTYRFHGLQLLLTVAEDTSGLEATSLYFQKRMLVLSLAALLLLLAMQIWVIRRGLRPLAGLKEELRQLERGEVERLEQPVPAEIGPLVEEVNRLLTVLQQRLQRSRNAVGNLSHALKTPLTLMFQILERKQDDKESVRLLEQARCIERHINRELSRARMAGQSPGRSWSHPAEDVRALIATLGSVYRQRVDVELQMAEITGVRADREDMLELIGNVIDNACKWAQTRVRLNIYQDAGLHVVIEDDGPGMSVEEQELVLERGVRMDETKHGHGLGLSIVREIVDAYNGSVELGRSESLGGLKVSLWLPNALTGQAK